MSEPNFETLEEYFQFMVDNGFWETDGKPIKCEHCEGANFKDVKEYYEDYWRIEYQVECQDCKHIIGHWAYGYWQV